MKINMDTRELQDYLGITDNEQYMEKAKLIMDFRQLEKLIENMNYKEIEVIRKEDFFSKGLHYDNTIIYEYNDLIVYQVKGE